MSVTLVTRDREIEVGGYFQVSKAFAEMVKLDATDRFPQLYGVQFNNDYVSEEYVRQVASQAQAFLAAYGERLSPETTEILQVLADS